MKSFILRYKYQVLALILVASLALKVYYVFGMTQYQDYLFSDFGGYWNRALQRYNGEIFNYNQWVLWPPFPHILLSWVFELISFFNMDSYRLEIILCINATLSTISLWLLYFIAYKLYPNILFAIMTSCLYALYYPFIYFNSFIVSEHIAIFATIVSLYVVLIHSKSKLALFVAGLVLALGVSARPAIGLYGLPFFLYILFANRLSIRSIVHATMFSLGFLLVLLLVFSENNHISRGKIKTFSANGGLNFYFAQCKTYKVESRAENSYYFIVPPATVENPENGILETSHPFYNQKYFFNLGLDCLQKNTFSWEDAIMKFRTLFFGALFPSVKSAKYFSFLLPLFQKYSFGAMLLLLLLAVIYKEKHFNRGVMWLLLSIIFANMIVMYMFNIEQRYFYVMWFCIQILSLLVVFTIFDYFEKYYLWIFGYFMIITLMTVYEYLPSVEEKKPIFMMVEQNKVPIASIYQKKEVLSSRKYNVAKINFLNIKELDEQTGGQIDKFENLFIDYVVMFELKNSQTMRFYIVSDDGFALTIDNNIVASFPDPRAASLTSSNAFFSDGIHTLKLSYFQAYGNMMLKLFYEIDGVRYLIGESSEKIKFLNYKK